MITEILKKKSEFDEEEFFQGKLTLSISNMKTIGNELLALSSEKPPPLDFTIFGMKVNIDPSLDEGEFRIVKGK